MARKKKSSPLDDMIDLVALMPWWAGIAIAIIGYLVLHRMAVPVQIGMSNPGQLGQVMTQTILTTFATAGQYIVPLIGLMGAVLSFTRRKQRAALIADVGQSNNVSALNGISWREFEMLVGEAYALRGYKVAEIGGGGPDGGVDLVLTKGGEKFFVQCKQWKAYRVGVDVVRELYGVMAAEGATGGFVVTSGRFTDDAKLFARGRNVELVDGAGLFQMIKQAKQSQTTKQVATHLHPARTNAGAQPSCPQCGSNMIKRTARKGGKAGDEFWGCSKFPACRGVRQIN